MTRQTDLISANLSGEHNFGAWTLFWRGSYAKSNQKVPKYVFMNFTELAASSGAVKNQLDAKEVISIFKNNLDETTLFDSRYGRQTTSERNNSVQLDLKRSFVVSEKTNGYVKFGSKIRNQNRKNDNTEWLIRPYLTTGTATGQHLGTNIFGFTTKTADLFDANGVLMYPNPSTNGKLYLAGLEKEKIQQVEILNINGQSVRTAVTKDMDFLEIDMSKMVSGTYLVTMLNEKGQVSVRKIVKE